MTESILMTMLVAILSGLAVVTLVNYCLFYALVFKVGEDIDD